MCVCACVCVCVHVQAYDHQDLSKHPMAFLSVILLFASPLLALDNKVANQNSGDVNLLTRYNYTSKQHN